MKTSSSLTLPLALLLALLGLTLAAPSPALGKDPKKKKEKEEIPEPSDEERLEIRQLMGRVGRARHPAKRSQARRPSPWARSGPTPSPRSRPSCEP